MLTKLIKTRFFLDIKIATIYPVSRMSIISGSKPKSLRKDNTRIILDLFKSSERLSSSDIREKIHLSRPTIMKILDQLEQEGFILNDGKGDSSDEGGRKPILYSFNAQRSYCIAFHIFPNEIYGVLTDLKSRIVSTQSKTIDSSISFEQTIKIISQSCLDLCGNIITIDNLAGIAIGSHGATDNKKGITFHAPHFHNWGNKADFRSALKQELNCEIQIYVDNQIRYQILSERIAGHNKSSENVIVIEAGVGLVAGIMSRNDINRGSHFLAGEIGHMIINPGGEVCACGGKGCFEAMVTTDRILAVARERYKENKNSIIFKNCSCDTPHIFDIFSASNNNDSLARELIDDLAHWFAIGIINLQLSYDPESIIIQGIYSQAGEYFLTSLLKQIKELCPLLEDKPLDIRLSHLGKNRSVIGATWLLSENYLKSSITKSSR